MKRFVIFFLLLVYSFSATGATFHLHFCSGHLHSVSLLESGASGCCRKMPHGKQTLTVISKKCCSNELASLKINDDQFSKTTDSQSTTSAKAIFSFRVFYSCFLIAPRKIFLAFDHAPPEQQDNSVYLLNRNFRI